MDKYQAEHITQALSMLEKSIELLKSALSGIETTTHTLYSVERYYSKSGNETWRCSVRDTMDTIYLRQSMRQMLAESHLLGSLEALDVDIDYDCNIVVETLPDGDFLKVVKIHPGWSIDS